MQKAIKTPPGRGLSMSQRRGAGKSLLIAWQVALAK